MMLAAPKVGAPVKWVEDRRENLLAAGQSRHEHATVKMAFDADGAIQAAYIDFVSDCGAYPTPWPVGPAAAVGMFFPGPYRVPRAGFATKSIYTNTVGRTAYRGPWQFETLAREVLLDIAARQIGHRPGRTAPAQRAAARRPSVRKPQRDALRQHLSGGDARAGARDARLRRVPHGAGRRPRRSVATSAWASRNYVEPSTPGLRRATRPKPRRSASSRRARSTCTSPAARAGTASRPRSCSSQPTRSVREHRGRQHDPGRHRGYRLRAQELPGAVAAR